MIDISQSEPEILERIITMKTVYFVQHGMALSKDIDATRPLSDSGAKAVHKMATQLQHNNIVIHNIAHSGKLRALQTALIFAQVLNIKNIFELKGMKPNDPSNELIEQITDDASMYVGHLPNIQNVVSNLVTADENMDVIKFQNCAVACIEINSDNSHIKWFILPELCA